jgi:hypothetical protein
MRIVSRVITTTSIIAATWLAATAASAATLQTVHVHPEGSNTTTCGTPASPCKTLAHARTRVNAGGTVFLTAPGNYGGGGTFTKAVNIRGVDGAGIFSPGAPCLTFNAGVGDVLTVSNIVCDQDGAAQDGFVGIAGHKMRLDNVTARGATGTKCGVRVAPGAGNFEIMVNGGSYTENGTTGTNNGGGMCLLPTGSAQVLGAVLNTRLQNNRHGLVASAPNTALVMLLLDNSDVSGNVGGIFSEGNSIVCVRRTTITYNSFKGLSSGGQVLDGLLNLLWWNGGGDAFDGPCL